jgi:cytochrome b561
VARNGAHDNSKPFIEGPMKKAVIRPRRRAIERFDTVTIWIHWATLLLVIVMFGTALARESVGARDTAALLLTVHRSTGVLLWLVTLGRVAWKSSAGRAPALPFGTPAIHRWAARVTEYGLLAFLILQPIAGFAQSVAGGKPFALFGISFPSVMARNCDLTHLFAAIHEKSALVLLVLIAIHTLAALLHHFVLHDQVLRTMLPSRRLEES